MKTVFLIGLMCMGLVGCGSDQVAQHWAAKSSTSHKSCYEVTAPQQVVGNYCLEYMGDKK